MGNYSSPPTRGITEQALDALTWLALQGSGTMPELRDAQNIPGDIASSRLAQLVRWGYVSRTKMPRARRLDSGILWQVTEAGRKLVIERMERANAA